VELIASAMMVVGTDAYRLAQA